MSMQGEGAFESLQNTLIRKLEARREECRKDAEEQHEARNYGLEAEYRHWVSALSEAILIVRKETY